MSLTRRVLFSYLAAVIMTAILVGWVQSTYDAAPTTGKVESTAKYGKYGECVGDTYCKHPYWKTTVKTAHATDEVSLRGDKPAVGETVEVFEVTGGDEVVLEAHNPTSKTILFFITFGAALVEGLIAMFLLLILEDRQHRRRY